MGRASKAKRAKLRAQRTGAPGADAVSLVKRPHRAGRPRVVLSEEQVDTVERLARVLTQEQIADYFGIAHRVFRDVLARQPEISAAYKRGSARQVFAVGASLLKAATDGDVRAQMFYLRTKGGWREAPTTIEHGVARGSARGRLAEMLGVQLEADDDAEE